MPHLEEGTIHELLDGELTGAEAAEITSHVESCADCAARLAEARQFMAEADRLIAGLDAPTAAPVGPPLPDLEIPMERTDRRVLMPASGPRGWRRRAQPRPFAWAAMLALVAGGGYIVLGRGGPEEAATSVATAPRDTTAPLTPAAAAVAVETAAADSGDSAGTAALGIADSGVALAQGRDAAAERSDAAAAPAEDRARATEAAQERAAREQAERDRAARESEARRVELAAANRRVPAPAAKSAAAPTGAAATAGSAPIGRRMADVAALEPGVARSQAAESVAQRSRPADSLLVATPPSVPVAAAPPRPSMDLMAQSQIALRIGLDEAKRELGGNLHVIDGLQPEFVGLVPGRLVPGADTGAYVVRVVYLDDEQRTIFLDQQRIRRRPGSPEGPVARLEAREDSGRSQWTTGNVRLSLNGSLPRDSLARLARKVR